MAKLNINHFTSTAIMEIHGFSEMNSFDGICLFMVKLLVRALLLYGKKTTKLSQELKELRVLSTQSG